MSVFELNTESIEILELSHRMSRASRCRFVLNSVRVSGSNAGTPIDPDSSAAGFGFGDSEKLATRQEVRYTADDGTILFVGKVLPARRSISATSEGIEYVAADIVEFLGNNPADQVNRFYNQNRNDSTAFSYPTEFTIEQIVQTEFARIIGVPSNAEHIIESIDWSKAEDLRGLTVYDFQTEGKSWLQLLDQLRDEIPMLAYWFDPRGADRSSDTRGVTLRFYNLSPASNGDDSISNNERVRLVLPKRDSEGSNNFQNIMSFNFDEDISQSYDKLTIVGWGDFYERYDKLRPAWLSGISRSGLFSNPDGFPDSASDKTVYPLRRNPDTGNWQRYDDSQINGGAWMPNAGNVWTPDRNTIDARRAFRRYQTPNKPNGEQRRIINFKAEMQLGTDEQSRLVSVENAIRMETISHIWYMGEVQASAQGVKIGPFTGGVQNDWGDVRPSVTYYPDYPIGPPLPGGGGNAEMQPKFELPITAVVEENIFFLSQPLVRETKYLFTENQSGTGWNNLVNTLVVLYWPVGFDLWANYTQWDEFESRRFNESFGYEKHLVLYEPRFFRYTNINGEVLRDDTAIMNEYSETLFDFLIKPRYYGAAEIDVSVLGSETRVFSNRANQRDIFIGSPIQIENWKPQNQYTTFFPKVLIQELDLSKYDSEKTVRVGFDNPQTFIPLENTKKFKSFFEGAFNNGIGGTNGSGTVGNGCGCGGGGATTQGPGGGGGGGGGDNTSSGTNPPPFTTPGNSSSGTTNTSGTSNTTTSSTTPTTTPTTTTTSSSSSSASTQEPDNSISIFTGSSFTLQNSCISSSENNSTTPAPAELFTGAPLEIQP